jgi:HlyD family secretion protein
MYQKKISIPIYLALLALLVSACAPSRSGKPTPTPVPPVVAYENAIFTVERGPIISETSVMGEVVPAKQEELFFRTSGYVTRVSVKQGDQIKKGDILAEMQVDDILNQLQQARIDLEVAQANLAKQKAQQEYDIAKAKSELEIWKKNVELAQLNYDNSVGMDKKRAEINLEIAKQNLDMAEQNLNLVSEDLSAFMEQAVKRSDLDVQRLEGLLAERQILAPFDGIVLKSSIRAGQQADAYFVSFIVGDPSELVVRSQYNYELSSKIVNKTEVRLYQGSDTKTGTAYPANYMPNFLPVSAQSSTEDTTNSSSGTDYMYFSIPTSLPEKEFSVGRTVTLVLVLGKKDDALLLPPAAIREYKGLHFVIVQEGDRRRRVEINEIGLKSTDRWEISGDLQEGDQVLGP